LKYEYNGKIYNNLLDAVIADIVDELKNKYNISKIKCKKLIGNALAMNIVQN
jgi:hypothetical protein